MFVLLNNKVSKFIRSSIRINDVVKIVFLKIITLLKKTPNKKPNAIESNLKKVPVLKKSLEKLL